MNKYKHCYKVFTSFKSNQGADYMYVYGSTLEKARETALNKRWHWKSLGITKVMIKKQF